MLYLLLATFGTVFVAELIGDKTIYVISSLAMRFRPLYVFCGFTVAFMAKMLAAVLLGQVIAELPVYVVAIVSTATFFATALVIWFKKRDKNEETSQSKQDNYFSKAALMTFAAIFFSEWGDVGQITAATLTARYQAPLIVWLGATLALITKGLLALTLGRSLRKLVPQQVLRPISASLCVVMGVVSALTPMLK
jgi:putative Ca2+/H+ antiporter (TMEM165/GDT1 family)